jgi:hypothetical protein
MPLYDQRLVCVCIYFLGNLLPICKKIKVLLPEHMWFLNGGSRLSMSGNLLYAFRIAVKCIT